MATAVLVVPGLLGTSLNQRVTRRPENPAGWTLYPPVVPGRPAPTVQNWLRPVWIDVPGFLSDRNVLLLNQRYPLTDSAVEPMDLLPNPYSNLLHRLGQMLPRDWFVVSYPWDWRYGLKWSGEMLAQHIDQLSQQYSDIRLVCHSAGGLIARVAWGELKKASKEGVIKRIVTLGTPHYGTYAPAVVWTDRDAMLDTLSMLAVGAQVLRGTVNEAATFTYQAVLSFGGTLTAAQEQQVQKIVTLATKWESLYDLLPDPEMRDDEKDIDRAQVYNLANWAACYGTVDQDWLSRASFQGRFQATVSNAVQYIIHNLTPPIPASVLTCVGGFGVRTPARCSGIPAQKPHYRAGSTDRRRRQDRMPNWYYSTAGDGYVTLASALEPGSRQYTVYADHAELMTLDGVLRRVPEWLQETLVDLTPRVETVTRQPERTASLGLPVVPTLQPMPPIAARPTPAAAPPRRSNRYVPLGRRLGTRR